MSATSSLATLPFFKYEGIGNDFVIVDEQHPSARRLNNAMVSAVCDRHRGVGADGVLLVSAKKYQPSMRVINADGSTPEMCGNGVRCVAFHLHRLGLITEPIFDINTEAGPHRCEIISRDGNSAVVRIDMRTPEWNPLSIPVRSSQPVKDMAIELDGHALHITAVSMGNPHVVTFDDVGQARFELGPRLEKDARFPMGVNVGFAQTTGDGRINLHVWERGVGWTRACGTGACAAAAAAVETGRLPRHRPIEVTLSGGTLTIEIGDPEDHIRMTGSARHVFDGVINL